MTSDKITGAKLARIGGREYTLVFDLDACDILDQHGLDPWGEELGKALDKPTPRTLKVLLFAGLRRHHPEMTLEEIGKLRPPQVVACLGPILEAIAAQMTPEEPEANPPMAVDGSPG